MIKNKKQVFTILRIGLAILLILFCAFGWIVASHDPQEANLSLRLQASSREYPFGTDTMGRCILCRSLYGGQATLAIIFTCALLILVLGTVSGLFLGYYKGRFAWLFDSLVDAFTAFPPMVYLIIFMGSWGSGPRTMLIALTMASWVRVAKLVKSRTELEMRKAYIRCAIVSGVSTLKLLFRHLMPNVLQEVIVYISLTCADMVLMMVSFSFVGLGLGDGVIDWGTMIAEGRNVSVVRPEIMLYPVLFIFITTFALNILGGEIKKS